MKQIKLMQFLCAVVMLLAFNIAYADIAIITHKGNKITSIEKKVVKRIFLGKQKMLSDGSILTPLNQAEQNDIFKRFSKKVLTKNNQQLISYWSRQMFTGKARPPETIKGDDAAIINAVTKDMSAISYVDASKVTDDVRTILIVKE